MSVTHMLRTLGTAAPLILAVAAASCSNPPSPTKTAVASIAPVGGATNVSTSTTITVVFTEMMDVSAEAYMSLHEGSMSGAAVPMSSHWSDDGLTLTMAPVAPLSAGTKYYIHMGGGMTDIRGWPIDYGACPGLGGHSANPETMSHMMGGEMGYGWKGSDGNYGMIFTFTTA